MAGKNYYAQLSPQQKAELFKIYSDGGYMSLSDIINDYNNRMIDDERVEEEDLNNDIVEDTEDSLYDIYGDDSDIDVSDLSALFSEKIANSFSEGGGIHIKPENRGKFTELKKRTGHSSTWFKEHGTPAQKKMAVFALNAAKWHADGGGLNNNIYWDNSSKRLPEIPYRYTNVTDDELVDLYVKNVLWKMENPRNRGYNEADGLYYAYKDKDAKGNVHINIGPGLEKNGHPDIDYSKGYTREELEKLARKTVADRESKMSNSLRTMQNGKYYEARDTLSAGPLLNILDIAYNVGTSKKKNLPESWPKLIDDIANGRLEDAAKHSYSGSRRRWLMRNDLLTYDPITESTVINR